MRSKAQDDHARDVLRSERWRRSDHTTEALVDALRVGRIAGPAVSHDRANVRWKIAQFAAGDPRSQFGLSGLGVLTEAQVMALMGEAAGFDADLTSSGVDGPVPVDPFRVLANLQDAGTRLAEAAARGERVLLATGHPVGLVLLYAAVGDLLVAHGASLLRPLDGRGWRSLGRAREIRYLHGVAILTDRGSSIHTHSSEPMERMLAAAGGDEGPPDLVFADHGFAGAAIEAGLDTISIADVNDPAPVAAAALGRTRTVVVMDDNVAPEDYWPCFQAIAARFPR
jgi:hypothetical protein